MKTPPTKAPAKSPASKYSRGDCVVFVQERISHLTDGTIMEILEVREKHYRIRMDHPKVSHPVKFTAVRKVFEWETKKTACK